MDKILKYQPDYAVHPGEILQEHLEARSLSLSEFAVLTGLSEAQISLMLGGKAPVTMEAAKRFEKVLGMDASVWVNLSSKYFI